MSCSIAFKVILHHIESKASIHLLDNSIWKDDMVKESKQVLTQSDQAVPQRDA